MSAIEWTDKKWGRLTGFSEAGTASFLTSTITQLEAAATSFASAAVAAKEVSDSIEYLTRLLLDARLIDSRPALVLLAAMIGALMILADCAGPL